MFEMYKEFRKNFLKRFTDPNPVKIVMEKLLNLQREKMDIQKYITNVLNLFYQISLEDQATKVLIFRRVYLQDQDQIMLTNSIKAEKKFKKKNMKSYLE